MQALAAADPGRFIHVHAHVLLPVYAKELELAERFGLPLLDTLPNKLAGKLDAQFVTFAGQQHIFVKEHCNIGMIELAA